MDAVQSWYIPAFSNDYNVAEADTNKLQFSRDGMGNVWVSGAFVKASALIANELVYVLPVGFRPSKAVYSVAMSGNSFIGNLVINSYGAAHWSSASALGSYTFNNGISIQNALKL